MGISMMRFVLAMAVPGVPKPARPGVKRRPSVENLEGRRLPSAAVPADLPAPPAVQLGTPSPHAHGDQVGRLTTPGITGGEHAFKKTPAKPVVSRLAASLAGPPDAVGDVTIVGKTFPKAVITVSLAPSNTIESRVKADKKGNFKVTVPVGFGTSELQTIARSGKKTAAATLGVNRPGSTPTPTPSPTPSPFPLPLPTPTPTPTPSPTPSPVLNPDPTPHSPMLILSIDPSTFPVPSSDVATIDGYLQWFEGLAFPPIQNVTVTLTTLFTTATYTATTDSSGFFQVIGVKLGGFSGDQVIGTATVGGKLVTYYLDVTHPLPAP